MRTPPSRDDLRFSNTTGIPQKNTMWFIGVDVERETSASPPKKNPGSAPVPALSMVLTELFSLLFPSIRSWPTPSSFSLSSFSLSLWATSLSRSEAFLAFNASISFCFEDHFAFSRVANTSLRHQSFLNCGVLTIFYQSNILAFFMKNGLKVGKYWNLLNSYDFIVKV